MNRMNTDLTLRVTEIQRFCMHDGPGVRTTVFLKGCPLRCRWCHNPEAQSERSEILFYPSKCISCGLCAHVCPRGVHTVGDRHDLAREKCAACGTCAEHCPAGALALSGHDMPIGEILSTVERDRAFYGDRGGVTLSGGEPFLQGEAALALLSACKAQGLSTAVETCGYGDPETFRAAVPLVNLFLWDIKDTDRERHRAFTGVYNDLILSNLTLVAKAGARVRVRCILVNGVNTNTAHYRAVAEIAASVQNLDGVELIPYHAYGGGKATFLGRPDNGDTALVPTEAQKAEAAEVLRALGVRVL